MVSLWTWQGWLISKLLEFAFPRCSHTSTVVIGTCYNTWVFTWVLTIIIQVLIHAKQELYSPIYLSNSFIWLSIVLVLIYIPTKKVWALFFSTSSPVFIIIHLFKNHHFNLCEVISDGTYFYLLVILFYFVSYVWVFYLYMFAHHIHAVHLENKRGHWISWKWN